MSSILSLRPDLDQNVDALPLYVAGLLPGGKPLLAYEGRLQIKNPSGPCTVAQIGGDALPPGASISVDSVTMKVVVAWPAYSEHVTPLANPGFETGDTSGWSFTPRGGSGVPVVDGAYRYEGSHSLKWPGGHGMGSEGGIEVEAWNNTIGPCLPGQRVTSHARCMYNPAGHNFGNRYQGLLRFLDGAGVPIGNAVRGKLFKGRGNNGRWNDASATGIGPAGTKAVQMGAWLTGSNAPVWLDAASWDVPSSLGINIEATLNLTLRVRDSAGRTALWSGSVVVAMDPTLNYYDELVARTPIKLWTLAETAGNFNAVGSDPTGLFALGGAVRNRPGVVPTESRPSTGGSGTAIIASSESDVTLSTLGQFTVLFSVKVSDLASTQIPVHIGNYSATNGQGWSFWITPAGAIGVEFFESGYKYVESSAATIVIGQPYQIALVRESTLIRIYVNDVQVATRAVSPAPHGSVGVTVGAIRATGDARYYRGDIQFLGIYSQAMTLADIQTLAAAGGFTALP